MSFPPITTALPSSLRPLDPLCPRSRLARFLRRVFTRTILGTIALVAVSATRAQEAPPSPASSSPPSHQPQAREKATPARLFIREFRVQGATVLPPADVQRAIYPFLGPGRTPADIEAARVALENLYRERGYQAASVEVPPQRARGGLIVLRVSEGEIGRLRVVGSRYYDTRQIRSEAPSLTEGRVPDFNAISSDTVALNRLPDRRIIPEVRPGEQPGVIDVNLKVEDHLPLDASAELNDRYSAGASKLRLNLAASYNNLWQQGHSFGVNAQTSPQDWDEVRVYSGAYTARFATLPEWTFLASATRQDTDISTLGGAAVAGRGEIYSLRATRVLPGSSGFFHSASFGIDRKDYDQAVSLAGETNSTPILYYPLALTYSGFLSKRKTQVDFFTGVTLHFRGLGSDTREFDLNRTGADANFTTVRADLSATRELPASFALSGRIQGQLASGPLLTNEQFAGGGVDTVRGYLEGQFLGDHGVFGSLELLSPSFIPAGSKNNSLRLLTFIEGGVLRLTDALVEQDDYFQLASTGIGLRFRINRHFDGAGNVAFPLIDQGGTKEGDTRVTFRIKCNL